MSTSVSGTTYASSVSGIAITSGGAVNTIGGGREIPIFTSIAAIAVTEKIISDIKRTANKNIFFIFYLLFGFWE
jgi:hypothetical protein